MVEADQGPLISIVAYYVTYCQTSKTVNTRNMSGMFIVLSPIKNKISRLRFKTATVMALIILQTGSRSGGFPEQCKF